EGIFMPKLSSTMQEGTLLQWLKEEGDTVEVGEPLFEIMTDKINIEVEAYEEGVLLKKYFDVDEVIPINTIIGYIGEANESVPDSPPSQAGEEADNEAPIEETTTETDEKQEPVADVDEKAGKVRATPAARRVASENDMSLSHIKGSGAKGRIHEEDVQAAIDSSKVLVTPLADKMIVDRGLDVQDIKGTGVRGKIEKDDVEAYLETDRKPSQALE